MQLSHWSVMVGVFVHVPRVSVRTCPTCGVPLIVGRLVLPGGGGGRATTGAVGAEVADAGFGVLGGTAVSDAVSTTSMVCPTSAAVSGKLVPVGPLVQLTGAVVVHTNHWSPVTTAVAGLGVALVTLRVWPSWAVPPMVGAATVVAWATPASINQTKKAPTNRQVRAAAMPRRPNNLFIQA